MSVKSLPEPPFKSIVLLFEFVTESTSLKVRSVELYDDIVLSFILNFSIDELKPRALAELIAQEPRELIVVPRPEIFKVPPELVIVAASPDIPIPITFSGTNKEVTDFIVANHINETERQTLGNNNPNIDKVIVRGIILNGNLEKIVNDFSNNDTISYGLGIQPNPYISSTESHQIGENIDKLMETRLKEIIEEKEGVKAAECRSKIVYNDNKENI